MLMSAAQSSTRTASAIVAVFLLTISRAAVEAHDMWIEPTTFHPQGGQIVGMRLRVGQDLLGDPLPRDGQLLREFVVEDAEGRKPVVGRDGSDPAGFVRAATNGLVVVGYHSLPSSVDLTPEKFTQYVREEGLEDVARWRAARGVENRGGRDSYTRCAKSLLMAGEPSDAQHDRALGLPLELVAQSNPYALREGTPLRVRLTYLQRALAGTLVVAVNKRHPQEKLSARTDRNGLVSLPVTPGGTWLIKAVHMVPAAAGVDADWSSYWASLTFGDR
jgi:hypothetical protein